MSPALVNTLKKVFIVKLLEMGLGIEIATYVGAASILLCTQSS